MEKVLIGQKARIEASSKNKEEWLKKKIEEDHNQ
jgi:hypothetical protein